MQVCRVDRPLQWQEPGIGIGVKGEKTIGDILATILQDQQGRVVISIMFNVHFTMARNS